MSVAAVRKAYLPLGAKPGPRRVLICSNLFPPLTSGGAEIVADVQARSVVVEGAIEGDISAIEAVAIRAGARVAGAIRGASISIEEGATVNGRIDADFELPPELGGKGGR